MYLRRFLVLLFVSVSSISAYAQDAKKTADDFATKWVAAYDAGDAAALAALFTADGVFNAPSGAVLKGRDAIEKALAGRIKAGWTKETVTTTDAEMAGTAVWAAGEYGLVWLSGNRPVNKAADILAGCSFVTAMPGARRCLPPT